MKTYDEEYSDLVKWAKSAFAEADVEADALSLEDGHDDRSAAIQQKVVDEWNRRLFELKEKYGIVLDEKEQNRKKAMEAYSLSEGSD